MTNDTNKLRQTRKDYLNTLNTQSDAALLRQQLTDLAYVHPDLFASYEDSAGQEPLDSNPVNWSKDYFSRQKMFAGLNFSRQRVDHLIDVREHLAVQGQEGSMQKPAAVKHPPRAGASTGFTPSVNLKKFAESSDLPMLRTALRMELNNNRLDAAALRAAVEWTKGHMPGLFESLQGKTFARDINPDRTQWDIEYYNSQIVYLTANFSEERFVHLIEVREHAGHWQQPVVAPTASPASAPSPAPRPAPAARPASAEHLVPTPRPSAPPSAGNLLPLLPVLLLIGGAIVGVATLVYVVRKFT